jgi:hypothetical protein
MSSRKNLCRERMRIDTLHKDEAKFQFKQTDRRIVQMDTIPSPLSVFCLKLNNRVFNQHCLKVRSLRYPPIFTQAIQVVC